MWQKERLHRIRSLLATYHRVTTDRIVAELKVSRETVRRDLIELESQGELQRVHGGAVLDDAEPPFAERTQTHVRAKNAIARQAALDVRSGQTLFLDAGSTTSILAKELSRLSGLTVITNSFDVAVHMGAAEAGAARRNRVIVLGGDFGQNLPATFGAGTILEIHRYRADVALLSPVAVDARHGATSFDHHEADVARAMAANADCVKILADHSKLGWVSRVGYCPSEAFGQLVTDKKATKNPALAALRRASIPIAIAQ